jgi:L-fuculokinase
MEAFTAIFDIGKTNKKFVLFDEALQEVHQEYVSIPEIADEDGHPCDDLAALRDWMQDTLWKVMQKYPIKGLNFSTYGASMVHLDVLGSPVGPLYNYTKPFPEALKKAFFQKYGPEVQWSLETASPSLGMLNAGLQLYWLKYQRPAQFAQIQTALHLPQFCSWLFSGEKRADYTSIGCHTGLWDYERKSYHRWVLEEGLNKLLAPIHLAYENEPYELWGQSVRIGTGIHDSSAALLPYIYNSEKPFLLLSTGTWSIALNPFNHENLQAEELARDCLNFMSPRGMQVRASRLFLGREHKLQLERLNQYFDKEPQYYQKVVFNPALVGQGGEAQFRFEVLAGGAEKEGDWAAFADFEAAYHRLMEELVVLQVQAIKLALGRSKLKRIFIDGGFSSNELFVALLKKAFPDFEFLISEKPLGSAIGAALALDPDLVSLNLNTTRYDT